MSVERNCECGALMGAYDLGCKICGKSFKVRDEYLVGKDILPEPPVDLWAAQQRDATSRNRGRIRNPRMQHAAPRIRSVSSFRYNFSTTLFLAISIAAVYLFREPLATDTSVLPYSILAVTLLISLIGLRSNNFFERIVMNPLRINHNREYYRLFSSGFGHINTGHFILNAIGLINFGPFLMDFLVDAYSLNAPLVFLIFYITAIAIADLPDLIRHRHNFEYTSIGASGAIAAVVAGAAISDPDLELTLIFLPPELAVPGIVYAIGYLAISIFLDYRGTGRVAHLAHAAGTVYGLIVVAIISIVFGLGFSSSSSSDWDYSLNSESNTTQGAPTGWAPSGFEYSSADSSFAYSFYEPEVYNCSARSAQSCIKLQIASEEYCTQLDVNIRFYDSQTGEEEWAEDQFTYFSAGVPQDVELTIYSRTFDSIDPPAIYCSIP